MHHGFSSHRGDDVENAVQVYFLKKFLPAWMRDEQQEKLLFVPHRSIISARQATLSMKQAFPVKGAAFYISSFSCHRMS
jgi:hypothetical protein